MIPRVVPLLIGSVSLVLLVGRGGRTAGGAPAPVTLDTDPHLIAWWKFDDTTGKSAVDSARGGHPGTLEGGLAFKTHSAIAPGMPVVAAGPNQRGALAPSEQE